MSGFLLLRASMGLSTMARPRTTPRTRFPVAEGVGIFVGIVAWDLLIDGQTDLVRALLITAPAAVVWFALRCWRGRNEDKGA